MSGDVHTPTNAGPDPVAPPPGTAPAGPPPPAFGTGDDADRPEIAAGAAFAGGLVVALILKRLTR